MGGELPRAATQGAGRAKWRSRCLARSNSSAEAAVPCPAYASSTSVPVGLTPGGDERLMSAAMLGLVTRGPMEFHRVRLPAGENPDWLTDVAARVGPELERFARDLVLWQADAGLDDDTFGFGTEIDVRAPLKFVAQVSGGSVRLAVTRADLRDFIVLQFLLLLQDVGVRNVRECRAPECARLFVKTYRREFCSPQCQKRVYARKMRGRQRELEERRRRARQRRQRGG